MSSSPFEDFMQGVEDEMTLMQPPAELPTVFKMCETCRILLPGKTIHTATVVLCDDAIVVMLHKPTCKGMAES